MDRSYDFKRKYLYWYSVLKNDSDQLNNSYSEDSNLDRYSIVSSLLFNRLLCLESLLAPYTISNDEQTYKYNKHGVLNLPNIGNLNSYVLSKRLLFNKIGIDSIVHDSKLIGEMINQMQDTLDKDRTSYNKPISVINHKEGINSCLRYLFQILKDEVQNYQRLRLKFESSVSNTLKIMSENLSEVSNLDTSIISDSIPNSYITHFIATNIKSQSHIDLSENDDSQSYSDKSGYSSPDPNILSISVSTNPKYGLGLSSNVQNKFISNSNSRSTHGSLNYDRGVYNISSNYIDESDMGTQQVTDTLVQQYARTVNSINDQIKANELQAINSVQERLTEISSMFVKLTGTVEQQNELHQLINANVQESLTNIEKTQDTLKKTSKENLPFYHRILCTALVGMSLFLLFIDYLKSSKGSYLF
ncbi:hypothetical protein MACK_002993 [Theileria orientalis]|uniref:t-SNARE coiled-coil homology domain-containing protein n=1 Tax=Theileria orientalis TaxID=68886 RepID=A0A976QVE3_THEOR|nr:hypothetical protein MACK_002993 [Theileria orientalis]